MLCAGHVAREIVTVLPPAALVNPARDTPWAECMRALCAWRPVGCHERAHTETGLAVRAPQRGVRAGAASQKLMPLERSGANLDVRVRLPEAVAADVCGTRPARRTRDDGLMRGGAVRHDRRASRGHAAEAVVVIRDPPLEGTFERGAKSAAHCRSAVALHPSTAIAAQRRPDRGLYVAILVWDSQQQPDSVSRAPRHIEGPVP